MNELFSNMNTDVMEPKLGEWWMCQSTETLRKSPMLKVKSGWCGITNSDGVALSDFVQKRDILTPLYKMVAA